MDPVNNSTATNEISQPINDAFLREKYYIPQQYLEGSPPDSAELLLLLVRCTEEALQAATESAQSSEELTNRIIRLVESSKELHIRLDSVIESSEKNTQALRELAKSSSEVKEITSNITNMVSICANRIFKPVQNGLMSGFCFLIGHRAPAEVLPKENQLATHLTQKTI